MCNQGITLLLSLQTCPALALTFTLTLNLTRILILTVSGGISLPSTWHGNPAKVFQVSFPAVHLARKPRKSVPGVTSRRPPGTVFPQKRVRCPFPAVHLARNPRESVPGGISLLPPGTEFLQKRSRCLSPPSTWYGISAKAFQVASPCFHLARNSCKSVPGVFSRLPPATEFLQKRSRWHLPAVHLARNSCKSVPGGISLPSTWHGIPAKVFQVALLVVHLPRYLCESVPGGISPLPTCHGFPVKEFQVAPLVVRHGIPAKAFQVASPCLPPGTVFPQKRVRCPFPAVHLARNPRESVSGVSSRLPPGTETLRKRGRCHFSPSTWHGIPAKVCQVSFPAVHLARKPRKSVPGVFSRLPPATAVHLIMGCCGFSVGHMAVFSMKRATISTPAAAEYMHLSENNDVPKKVQLQVSHVWTHLQYQNRLAGACRAHLSLRVCRVMLHLEMTTLCDDLTIKDFAIYVFCRCASALINTDA